ncbi:hypothetical protein L7F22_031352 [Adiantum nelumboides]|nr:hypothetical protein [Adiantum nelumboides]
MFRPLTVADDAADCGLSVKGVPNVDVVPDVSKLVMAGHSRGGKIAFAMALGKTTATELPSFSALVTLDPVDGTEPESEMIPQMVKPGCNHTDIGYGSKPSGPFGIVPPCAPQP